MYTPISQTSLALPSQDVRIGTRVNVSNLPSSATAEGLTARFCKFGIVLSVELETKGRASRRVAVVEMETSADAYSAIAALNLSDFEGSLVSVYLAFAGSR